MIENEAKQRWCPMVRFADPIDGKSPSVEPTAWNRFDGGWDYAGLLCIASDCMMWRWETPAEVGRPYIGGHCGLAGKI